MTNNEEIRTLCSSASDEENAKIEEYMKNKERGFYASLSENDMKQLRKYYLMSIRIYGKIQ